MNLRTPFLAAAIALSLHASADPIGMERARALAQQFTPTGQQAAIRKSAPRRMATTQTPPYYIFSRGAGKGYVIVAGDDCIPSIIGYTEQGDFDETREAPQLLAMLEHYATVVETLQAEGRNAPCRVGPARARASISPLLTSHWHQTAPYNNRVPKLADGSRALTGCVATAGSQVFYYWRKDMPATVPYTTPTYGYGDAPATEEFQIKKGTPLKWELMCDSYSSQPAEYHDAVAILVAAVGMQTYLTYGASTGGYIWSLPFEQYNLNSKRADKEGNFTDDTWEALIYSDLQKGYPIVYSGYKEDWEGHALVVDGYRASGNLFHFNYGWGGQSDGYYTVRESFEFGMQPTVMYDIHPIRYNLSGKILFNKTPCANATNDVLATVANHTSVPYSGFHLFASKKDQAPTALKNAIASDETAVVDAGAKGNLLFSAFTPDETGTWWLTLTDNQLNVIDKQQVEVAEGSAQLWVDDFRIEGNEETEQHGDDLYTVVYNNRTTASVLLRNEGDAGFERAMRLAVYRSDDGGATWQPWGHKTGRANVPAHGQQRVMFSVSSTSAYPFQQEDELYRVQLVNPVPNTTDTLRFTHPADTTARFLFHPADLEVVSYDDGVLTLKGHWDHTLFFSNDIARRPAYTNATVYDLTAVTGVSNIEPSGINPNALFYVADDATAEGTNVVSGGLCGSLAVTPGHDFTPRADFHASKAAVQLGGKCGQWCLLTAPFAAPVPDGMVARRIDRHDERGIAGKTTDVMTFEPGATYMVMTSWEGNNLIEGESTLVKAAPVTEGDNAVVGTYTNIKAPENAMAPTHAIPQHFDFLAEGETVEALRGYFLGSDITNAFSVHNDAVVDPAYLTLASAIDEAHGILSRYAPNATDEAYETYLTAIREAEHLFTHRAGSTLNTAAKVRNYAAQLLEKADEFMMQLREGAMMEVDFTSMIQNPSFEFKNVSGWTLTTPVTPNITATTAARVFANSSYNYLTAGADGEYILNNSYNHTNEDGERQMLGVGLSQQVDGLSPGYYRMSVKVASDEGNEITAFAGDSTITVTAHNFGKHYFAEAVIEKVKVEAEEGATTGSLSIGIMPGTWFKADDFRLVYTGPLSKDTTPDGIRDLENTLQPSSKGIYTLYGIKVLKPTAPGIYIINGKKVMVK